MIFVFNQYILPNTSQATQDFFRAWLPMTSVNEAMIWVIAAIGLNIVVGYAGLLDLGFVAFWAIGGYCAGWLMSGFFYQTSLNFFGAAPVDAPGIHINFWMVVIVAAAFCALCGMIIGAPTCDCEATTSPSSPSASARSSRRSPQRRRRQRAQPDQRHQGHHADRPR